MSEWNVPATLHIHNHLFVYVCISNHLKQEVVNSKTTDGIVQLKCDGTWRTGGEVKRKLVNGVGSQYSSHYFGTWCIQHYYRWCAHLGCPVVDWTDAPADLNGLVRFAERRNAVSARVPSRFKRGLAMCFAYRKYNMNWPATRLSGESHSFCAVALFPDSAPYRITYST
jgi:hypothetical protein